MKEKIQSALIVAFIIVVFFSSIGFVFAQNNIQQNSGYYQLNLVIEKQPSGSNASGEIYSFYVLSNGVLESSNIIKVPFGKEVRISIVNFDPGTSLPFGSSAENASGVVGGSILATGSVAAGISQQLSSKSAQSISEIPARDISHTFTTSTGLNIPVLPLSTEVAYTYFNTVGNYTWGCMCDCGAPSMDSTGSMTGQFVVLAP